MKGGVLLTANTREDDLKLILIGHLVANQMKNPYDFFDDAKIEEIANKLADASKNFGIQTSPREVSSLLAKARERITDLHRKRVEEEKKGI